MLKTTRLVPLLLTAWLTPADAADCLQQIDNLTVEFDLPAAEGMSGAQSNNGYYIPPPPDQAIVVPPPATMTPPGRPGAPRGSIGGTSVGATTIPTHGRLTPARRTKLITILQDARGVEALGNEPRCFELLREAQAVSKEKG